MKLLIGLGNPGKEYEHTRHNAGALVLEYCISAWREDSRFEDVGREKNRSYQSYEFRFSSDGADTETITVLFPQTFMNASGEAVRKYLARTADAFSMSDGLWVFHDDIDISFGDFKISKNASSAGHNGVQSIIDHLGTKDFVRFRIGIKPSRPLRKPTEQFVLKRFSKKESEMLVEISAHILSACETGFVSGIPKAQSVYNKKNCS